jgi:gliding motility-associated-like protein
MIKEIILLAGFCLAMLKTEGQNLVLNPSLEEYYQCPFAGSGPLGSIHNAKYWSSAAKTPDYLQTCNMQWGVYLNTAPANFLGYQQPKTGAAYSGIAIYDYLVNDPLSQNYDYREYIQGTLSMPLEKDTVYRASFFVSLADKSTGATSRLGMLFSKDSIKAVVTPIGVSAVIAKTPQVENPIERILTDTAAWAPVCGYFRASGGERHFTLGNYHDRVNTPYVPVPSLPNPRFLIYYYIDDVSVQKASVSPYEWLSDRRICSPDSISRYEAPDFLTDVRWSTGDTAHAALLHGPGTYWVRAAWDGCYFTDTIRIEHTPAPAFAFADDTLTICASDLPLALQITDCCADEVLWSTGDTATAALVHAEGPVWVQAENGCGGIRDSLWLWVDQPLTPDLGPDTFLCDTLPFARTLHAPQARAHLLWSTGASAPAITVAAPGTYWLHAENACGLFADTVVIQDLARLHLELGPDTVLCLDGPIPLAATPGFDVYRWNTGEAASELSAQDYGLYVVTATNACGEQRDSVRVIESNYPQVQLPDEVEIALGDATVLMPDIVHNRPLNLHWFPPVGLNCTDCPAPTAAPTTDTRYVLTVEDDLRCREAVAVRVRVLDRRRIYIPNVFSPNGDGQNDLLSVSLGPEVERIAAVVFDRWGNLLHAVEDRPAASDTPLWDGTSRGLPAPPGVYIVVLEVTLLNGNKVQVAGDVTVVR